MADIPVEWDTLLKAYDPQSLQLTDMPAFIRARTTLFHRLNQSLTEQSLFKAMATARYAGMTQVGHRWRDQRMEPPWTHVVAWG